MDSDADSDDSMEKYFKDPRFLLCSHCDSSYDKNILLNHMTTMSFEKLLNEDDWCCFLCSKTVLKGIFMGPLNYPCSPNKSDQESSETVSSSSIQVTNATLKDLWENYKNEISKFSEDCMELAVNCNYKMFLKLKLSEKTCEGNAKTIEEKIELQKFLINDLKDKICKLNYKLKEIMEKV